MRRYTITQKDVGGKRFIRLDRFTSIDVQSVMGRVMFRDVGKRMVQTSKGVWQVENDEQFHKRTGSPHAHDTHIQDALEKIRKDHPHLVLVVVRGLWVASNHGHWVPPGAVSEWLSEALETIDQYTEDYG